MGAMSQQRESRDGGHRDEESGAAPRRSPRARLWLNAIESRAAFAALLARPSTVTVEGYHAAAVAEYLEWVKSGEVELPRAVYAWPNGVRNAYVHAVMHGLGVLSPVVVARTNDEGKWIVVDGASRTSALMWGATVTTGMDRKRLLSAPLLLVRVRVPSREAAMALRLALNECRGRGTVQEFLERLAELGGKWAALARAAELVSRYTGVSANQSPSLALRALCVLLLYPKHDTCASPSFNHATPLHALEMRSQDEIERLLSVLEKVLQRVGPVDRNVRPGVFASAVAKALEECAAADSRERAAYLALLPYARGVGHVVTIPVGKVARGLPESTKKKLKAVARKLVESGTCSGVRRGKLVCNKAQLREFLRRADPSLPL